MSGDGFDDRPNGDDYRSQYPTPSYPPLLQPSAELDGGLEYPHYTRPSEFRGWRVPDVLLSGDHGRIDEWRMEQSRQRSAP